MTHEYEGHYRAKHPQNRQLDPALAKRVSEKVRDGRLTCSSAFNLVEETGKRPDEIGCAADLLELKITKCQLGLFGHVEGRRSIVVPADEVSPELEEALCDARVAGKLSCEHAWGIARQFGLTRMAISSACERLGIRIGSCQLGTF